MSAQVHQIPHTSAAGGAGTSAPPPGGNTPGTSNALHHFPHNRDGTMNICRTVTTAFSPEKIKAMLTTFLVLGVVFFLVEFGASFGTQHMSARDGFGQFNGNIFAITCLALLTSCAFVGISVLWEKDTTAAKAIGVFIYIVAWASFVVALTPEIMPKARQFVESLGSGGVFAGGDNTGATGGSWIAYVLVALIALLVTAPGLLLIWAKLNYSKWIAIRDDRAHAGRLLAIDTRSDAHKANVTEAEKAAEHLEDAVTRDQTNTSALSSARESAIAWLENTRKRAAARMNDVMTPTQEKASLYAEIQRHDQSLASLRALTI